MPISKIENSSIEDTAIHGARNLIINGAMQVAQRSTSATGLGASSGYFTVDRINFGSSGTSAGRFTMTQTADGPSGFANCLKLDCTTADASVAATEWEYLQYSVEAQDLQRLGFGSSDAESFVLSFYVKGNAAATYTIGAYQVDANRWMAQTFSVTSSWNRVSLLWPKDVSGSIADDNGTGMSFYLTLQVGTNFTSGSVPATWETLNTTDIADSGQTQFFDSTSRTLSITGLQMEIGEQATPFEHESFAATLQKCQRYFQKRVFTDADAIWVGANFNATSAYGVIEHIVTMRTEPSGAYSGTLADYKYYSAANTKTPTAMAINNRNSENSSETHIDWSGDLNSGGAGWLRAVGTNAFVQLEAEL
tara:strand:+ start:606 stop:1697 length:1092 start_codon:yes stop_codon:yes gene_type:complete